MITSDDAGNLTTPPIPSLLLNETTEFLQGLASMGVHVGLTEKGELVVYGYSLALEDELPNIIENARYFTEKLLELKLVTGQVDPLGLETLYKSQETINDDDRRNELRKLMSNGADVIEQLEFEKIENTISIRIPYDKSSTPKTPSVSSQGLQQESSAHHPTVRLTCAADIEPEPIQWLWNGWLAKGKFHILAGEAGTGKTTLALALAAVVSTGGSFPDGVNTASGNILIWSGEDGIKDTLTPRLIAAGADRTKVYFVNNVMHNGETRSFDPATDMKILVDKAALIGDISLLIVDPVVNAVAGNDHKNNEVRRSLQPLVDFGRKLGCAVLGITHFSKNTSGRAPLDRVTGSLAFGALPRIVIVTARNTSKDGSVSRIFCRAKSNIGPDSGGFEYGLQQKELDTHTGILPSYVTWGEAIEGSAKELLAEEETSGNGIETAEQFLRDILAFYSKPQREIEEQAKLAGISFSTLKRAKKKLRVLSKKDGTSGRWFWSLPEK